MFLHRLFSLKKNHSSDIQTHNFDKDPHSSSHGKANLCIDLNKAGMPSSGARKIGRKAFENEKVGKIAIFGLHPVARIIASFVMGVTRKEDLRFFKTKEEALAWLMA